MRQVIGSFVHQKGDKMKNRKVFEFMILAIVLISVSTVVFAEEAKPPGPDFHDGSWQEQFAQENWLSARLTLVGYFKPSSQGTEIGMEVYYNSEIIMKAWGVVVKAHKLNFKNTLYAIKQEDGNWQIGNQGQEWWEVIEEQDKVWFFITTESGLKEGRGFPKGDMPEELPEMEID